MTSPNLISAQEISGVPSHCKPKVMNPKDIIGSTKVPLDVVPTTLAYYDALAYLEGAVKYGPYNWRIAGVRASIYIAAYKRHQAKYEGGEWADQKTGVPHLASARACQGIILDAQLCGKLVDDRPPMAPIAELEAATQAIAAKLREMFKDHKPHQYTIADSPALRADQWTPEQIAAHPPVPTTLNIIKSADERFQQRVAAYANDDWSVESVT